MENWYERTEMLLGKTAVEKIKASHVAVFGVGGVGSFAVEALVRAGVGRLTLVDAAQVSHSNRNRQIIATLDTVGRLKVEVMKERILTINPEAVVHTHHCFVLPGDTMEGISFGEFSYVVDAVDTVTAKLELAIQAKKHGVPLISCMGTGNKLDPSRLEVTDIYRTSVCPLARVMRKELKAKGVEELEVVYSREESRKPCYQVTEGKRRSVPGSVSFVPSSAGLLLAATVIRRLTAGMEG